MVRSKILDEIFATWKDAKARTEELKTEYPDGEISFQYLRQDSLYHVRVYEDDRTGEDVDA